MSPWRRLQGCDAAIVVHPSPRVPEMPQYNDCRCSETSGVAMLTFMAQPQRGGTV